MDSTRMKSESSSSNGKKRKFGTHQEPKRKTRQRRNLLLKDNVCVRNKRVEASFGPKFDNGESLPIITWNPTSLYVPGRLNELKKLIARTRPALLAIQEWRNSGTPPFLKGYHHLVRGLSLLYVRDDISYHLVEQEDVFPNIHSVQIISNEVLYIAIYVHPLCETTIFKSFLEHQHSINKKRKKCIFGDLNVNCSGFGLSSDQSSNKLGKTLDNFLEDCNWYAFSSASPSFVQSENSSTGRSYLDGFLINVPCPLEIFCEDLFNTQHRVLMSFGSFKTGKMPSPVDYEVIKRTDWKAVLNKAASLITLPNLEWIKKCVVASEEFQISTRKGKFSQKGNNSLSPWWNKECQNLVHRRRELKKLFIIDSESNAVLEPQIRNVKHSLKRAIRKAKGHWEAQVVYSHQKNPWTAVKILRGSKRKKIALRCFRDSEQIASKIAEGLSKVASDIPPLSTEIPTRTTSFQLDEWEIDAALRNSATKKSRGSDNVSTALLVKLWNSGGTKPKLKSLIEEILNSIPTYLKHSIVHPLEKEDGGWRPISLLSQLIKLSEKILVRRLNNIIPDFNRQFCGSGMSTTLALTHLQHRAVKLGENGIYVFLDISKAYDRIEHQLLLDKMRKLVPIEYVEWLEDWLRGRTYQVRYGEAFSKNRKVDSGIPQGSPISPFLFKVFLYDVPVDTNDFVYMDDILLSSSSYCNIERKLSLMEKWAKLNNVIFSEKKTKVIFASSLDSQDSDLIIQDFYIEPVREYKYLGVILGKPIDHQGFDLKKQWKSEKKEVSKRIAALTLFQHATAVNMRTIYFGLVRSKIDYSLLLQFDFLEELQIQQNAAIRIMSGIPKLSPNSMVSEMERVFRIPSIVKLFQTRCTKYVGRLLTQGREIPNSTLPASPFYHMDIPESMNNLWIRPSLKLSDVEKATGYQLSQTLQLDGKLIPIQDDLSVDAFCDGGFHFNSQTGTVGGYVDLPNDNLSFADCYSNITSSYRIETLAFKRLLNELFRIPPHLLRVRIFSDSLSLFMAITHLHIQNNFVDPIWSDILSRIAGLKEFGIDVSLHWIRGHAGTKGNEIADKLCTNAFSIPNSRWKSDNIHLNHFNQKIAQHPILSWNSVKELNGSLRRIVCRAFMNIGSTRNRTHHYSGNPNAFCRYCFESIETVHHILFDCKGVPNAPPPQKICTRCSEEKNCS